MSPPQAAAVLVSPPAQAPAPKPAQASQAVQPPVQAPHPSAAVASLLMAPVPAPQQQRSLVPAQVPLAAVQPPIQALPPAPQAEAPIQAPVQAQQAGAPRVGAPAAPPPAPAPAGLPGIRIPVTMLSGPPITAPVTAPALAPQPQATAPGPAAQAPGPFLGAALAPAPAQNINALLNALSPADRSVVANQNLSSLAGAAGQNLSSVNGENLSPYSNTTAGTLLGSIIATGNPLAPVPAPEAQPLLTAVGAEGTPPAGASSAAVPSSGEAGIRRTRRLPVLGSSEDLAPAPLTEGGASSAEAAALQAAGAPTQSADAALAEAAAAAAAQQFGEPPIEHAVFLSDLDGDGPSCLATRTANDVEAHA